MLWLGRNADESCRHILHCCLHPGQGAVIIPVVRSTVHTHELIDFESEYLEETEDVLEGACRGCAKIGPVARVGCRLNASRAIQLR